MTPRPADGEHAPVTIAVEVKLFATFREAVGEKTVSRTYHSPVTVRAVLADLEDTFPGLRGALLDGAGELQPSVSVVRNGRNAVHFDGLDTTLEDGDTLAIMPPLSGGTGRPRRRRT